MSEKLQHAIVNISPNGDSTFIYDDELSGLSREGQAVTTRASYVEPDGDVWYVDLSPVGGPILDGFVTRGQALQAEKEYLNQWLQSTKA